MLSKEIENNKESNPFSFIIIHNVVERNEQNLLQIILLQFSARELLKKKIRDDLDKMLSVCTWQPYFVFFCSPFSSKADFEFSFRFTSTIDKRNPLNGSQEHLKCSCREI